MRLLNLNIILSVFMSMIAPNTVSAPIALSEPSAIVYDIENYNGASEASVPGWDIKADQFGVEHNKTSNLKGLVINSENGFNMSTELNTTENSVEVAIKWYVVESNQATFTVSTMNDERVIDSKEVEVEAGKVITSSITLNSVDASRLAITSDDKVGVVVDSVKVVGIEIENSEFESSMIIPGWVNAGDLITKTYQGTTPAIYLYDSVETTVLVKTKPIKIKDKSLSNFSISFDLEVLKQTHSVEIAVRFMDGKKVQTKYVHELLKDKVDKGTISVSLSANEIKDAEYFEIVVSSGKPSHTEVLIKGVGATQNLIQVSTDKIHETLYNPDLELDTKDALGWNKVTRGGTVSLSNAEKLSGSSSLYFLDTITEGELDISAPRVMSDKFKAVAGDDLRISANVYAVQQTHNIVLEAYFYNESGSQIGQKQELFSSNSLGVKKWSKMNLVTKVPENTHSMSIAFYSGQPSVTEAYFDDISVTVMPKDKPLEREYMKPENLGPMVDVSLGQAAAIGVNPKGELEVYFHSNGLPGTFSVLDGNTGELKFSQVAQGTEAVWGMVIGLDGTVYFASTGDGSLFAYDPIRQELKTVGVNPTDQWTWDLELADDGKIYGSTYPNAGVWEYDPSTGKFRDFGPMVSDAAYVRGIAVEGDYIYAATGTVRHLIKLNRHTGEKTEIVIEGHTGTNGFFEDLRISDEYFFLSSGSVNMLVVDRDTLEVVDEFHYNNNISKPDPNNPNMIYFKSNQKLMKYDTSKLELSEVKLDVLLPDTARVKDFVWIEDELVFITAYGEYMFFNPKTETLRFQTLDIAAQPVAIQALEAGFDGKLYMGGYQRGMSIFNPFTGEKEVNISSFAQPEGIGFMNGKVYYGTYVAAIMYALDPSKPVELGNNPNMIHAIGDHQDRPFALTSGDNKLFVGTVPDYGMLGGVLAIYDETTDSWFQERNVVQDQSIIALEYHDGLLYGGTSIWGGLDATLTQEEAKLFIWDTKTNTKVKEMTLDIPGIDEAPKMIGGLSVGPDGLLWGIVDGTIFAMDLETHEIVKSKMIQPSKYNSSKWFPYRIQWGPDGTMYTTLSRQLIAIDTDTLQYQIIVSDFMNNMSVNLDGTIFYALGNELYQIKVPETDATLKDIKVDGKTIDKFSPGQLDYKLEIKDLDSIEVSARQSGSTVTTSINEEEKAVEITVLATDKKSMLTYTLSYGTIALDNDSSLDVQVIINQDAFDGLVDAVIVSVSQYFESIKDLTLTSINSLLDSLKLTVDQFITFSITPKDIYGNPVQLKAGESQEFSVEIPSNLKGNTDLKVFHINKDGSVDVLESYIKDGRIYFVVESFSDFMIASVKDASNPGTQNPQVPSNPGTGGNTNPQVPSNPDEGGTTNPSKPEVGDNSQGQGSHLPATGMASINTLPIIASGLLLVLISFKKRKRS